MADDLLQPDPAEPVIPDVKYDDLVGEGKKYRTPDDLAKANAHKDAFIEQLKREAAEARDAAQKRANEEEFLTKLETLTRGRPSEVQDPPAREEVVTTAVTPETVEQIIEKREAERTRKTNLEQALSQLKEAFGDDYKRHVQKQAQALGVSTAKLTELASESPQVFLRLVGIDRSQMQPLDAFSPPPRSSMQLPTGSSGNTKDYGYYRKMRQEKGEGWYFSLPVQKEIWEQAKTLGGDPEARTGFWKD